MLREETQYSSEGVGVVGVDVDDTLSQFAGVASALKAKLERVNAEPNGLPNLKKAIENRLDDAQYRAALESIGITQDKLKPALLQLKQGSTDLLSRMLDSIRHMMKHGEISMQMAGYTRFGLLNIMPDDFRAVSDKYVQRMPYHAKKVIEWLRQVAQRVVLLTGSYMPALEKLIQELDFESKDVFALDMDAAGRIIDTPLIAHPRGKPGVFGDLITPAGGKGLVDVDGKPLLNLSIGDAQTDLEVALQNDNTAFCSVDAVEAIATVADVRARNFSDVPRQLVHFYQNHIGGAPFSKYPLPRELP